jgi:hypothetical protein
MVYAPPGEGKGTGISGIKRFSHPWLDTVEDPALECRSRSYTASEEPSVAQGVA